jgi:hypothetical protein
MPAVVQPSFTEVEAKLLRLTLCPSAHAGEVASAGRALIASWRKRGLMAETLLVPHSVLKRPPQPSFGDFIMPFGKCRGWPLRKIKPRYLRWILENCDNLQPELERAIRAVLYV